MVIKWTVVSRGVPLEISSMNCSLICFSSSREKEWEKHGTCGGCIETLNSPKKFFGAALFLHTKYNIDRWPRKKGGSKGTPTFTGIWSRNLKLASFKGKIVELLWLSWKSGLNNPVCPGGSTSSSPISQPRNNKGWLSWKCRWCSLKGPDSRILGRRRWFAGF